MQNNVFMISEALRRGPSIYNCPESRCFYMHPQHSILFSLFPCLFLHSTVSTWGWWGRMEGMSNGLRYWKSTLKDICKSKELIYKLYFVWFRGVLWQKAWQPEVGLQHMQIFFTSLSFKSYAKLSKSGMSWTSTWTNYIRKCPGYWAGF